MSALRLRSGPRDQKPREELPLWYFSEATLVIKTSRSRCSDLPLELLTYLFSSCWAWPEVCQCCFPCQRTNSWFYWCFSIVFFNLYLFPPWSLLFPSLCWLWVLFVLLHLIFLPGKSRGGRNLTGDSPRGRKESGTTGNLFYFIFFFSLSNTSRRR